MKKLFLILVIGLFLLGCASEISHPALEKKFTTDKLKVVTTFYPVYDYAVKVGGDKAEVKIMTPPGLNAHSLEPTPSDIILLNKADVIVYNGPYFEIWARDTFEGLSNKNVKIVSVGEVVTLLDTPEGIRESLGPIDPHTWLTAKNAVLQVRAIEKAFNEKDPNNAEYYKQNADSFVLELEQLHSDYVNTLKTCERREIFVSHFAFGYMAREYTLEQIPIINNYEPSGEVSLQDIDRLVKSAKEKNAKYVFAETAVDPKLSEAIARQVNAKVLFFTPMEAYTQEDLETNIGYIGIMKKNLSVLKEALTCGNN
ncbi:zinc ABC transporter substrate-binding protein [Candidatus Micrarchaeota archaeon]|nr:zinc ABC transporter substrate-binding protein [Candidatus Micrarchaeota archaeon]